MKPSMKCLFLILLAGMMIFAMNACGKAESPDTNLAGQEKLDKKVVNVFTPMEKSDPNAKNIARSAFEKTVIMAEDQLGVTVEYQTYTAADYQEKTYDELLINRAHSNMDDLYLLNPDALLTLGEEGELADLSGLKCVKNLREAVKTANTVDGKLVGIPQEVVAYGLFVNKDMFDKYKLKLPNTPEELLACCETFKKKGIETPIGANRWWLECFVFAQGFADLYNGGNTDAEIEAINSGKVKLSDYMRPGFEFLQELIDREYIDAEKAYVSEALEGERQDFLAQKTPIVMAYWGAANTDTAYGSTDFNMRVIGFPSKRGQMPVVPITGYGVGEECAHKEDAMAVLDVMLSDKALKVYAEENKVISPSKNVEVDCVDALKPLNEKVNEGVYVLGSNANLAVEQWGNTCLIVRDLLKGASVDECMEKFDKLQEEKIKEQD